MKRTRQRTVSNSEFYSKVGRKVVYNITPYGERYIMSVMDKDGYFQNKFDLFPCAHADIDKDAFRSLSSRDRNKIFFVLLLDFMYNATAVEPVVREVEVTDDCVRLLWRSTGVINEFVRRKAA